MQPTQPQATPQPVIKQASALVARYGNYPAFAATAKKSSIAIFDIPGGTGNKLRSLANPQPSGAPLTFLLKDAKGKDWLEVYLPVRPNGSSGWVRAAEISVTALTFRVDVHVKAHRLRLFENGRLRREYPVGVGTANTPTPLPNVVSTLENPESP